MSKRAAAFLFLFLILSVIAIQTGRRLFFNMAYLLGATLLLSFLWAWLNLRWVGLSRTTRSLRAQVGRPVEELLAVRNKGWLPKLWLEVYDASELPGHRVSRVIHGLSGRHTRSWTAKTNARYRGRYRLGPMQLVSGDPLGLFTFRRTLPQTSAITIYPATYDLPGFTPPVGRLLGGASLERRSHNVTPNFAGVRDYMPGDAYNRIHWRSSARTGRLIVKEFEEDPTADVWIALDMHHQTHAEDPNSPYLHPWSDATRWLTEQEKPPEILPTTTEYAVTVTASIIKHFLGQNRSVGMVAHAAHREVMQPDRGLRPLTRALEFLAVLHAEGQRTLGEMLALEEQFFTRGATLVIVTANTHTAWVNSLRELRRRGVRLVVVLINPASFNPIAKSVDEVQAALAIQGVPLYLVNQGQSLPEALSAPATVAAPKPPASTFAPTEPSYGLNGNGSGWGA